MPRGPVGREKGVRFEQWRNRDVEEGGIVKISGKFLLDHEEDILNLVKKEGKLAEERNNNARITKIDKMGSGIVVETSDHNLASRIGKALHRSYKGEHQLKFREGEKFVEVNWRRD
jgi:hypothetical protein